jgi:hypothetical protein
MFEVRERESDAETWADAYKGQPPQWDRFFDGYVATLDWPASPFWPQISAAFPDSLILLSVRDADAWWKSASNTIFVALATYFAPDAPDDGWTRMGRGMMTTFTPGWQDEASAKAAYLAYNDHVRESAPKDRFLEWHPEDGWDPLCAALDLDVPDQPFPHANTTSDARRELGFDV